MKITSNETSFALLKSIIAEDFDAYEVISTINFSGYRVSDFAGKSRARKINKAQTKQMNITGYSIFVGFGFSYARINSSGVKFVLSFILYSLHLLAICANFPFCLHLCHGQSTPYPQFGQAKAYDRISPHEADMTMSAYPDTADLSANHRASVGEFILRF